MCINTLYYPSVYNYPVLTECITTLYYYLCYKCIVLQAVGSWLLCNSVRRFKAQFDVFIMKMLKSPTFLDIDTRLINYTYNRRACSRCCSRGLPGRGPPPPRSTPCCTRVWPSACTQQMLSSSSQQCPALRCSTPCPGWYRPWWRRCPGPRREQFLQNYTNLNPGSPYYHKNIE